MRSCMSKERTVKMKGKHRLQERGVGKSLFKLPNLIEVEAGCRIPESEQKITNKQFVQSWPSWLPYLLTGSMVHRWKWPFSRESVVCLKKTIIYNATEYESSNYPPQQAVKLLPLPDYLVHPVPFSFQAEPPHHPGGVQHPKETSPNPSSLRPEGLQ